jgi:cell division septation protein DedD
MALINMARLPFPVHRSRFSVHGPRFFAVTVLIACVSLSVYGQSGSPVFLDEEIQNLEAKLKSAEITPAERHDSLTRLARLFALSGNIEGAAETWNKAAFAGINGRDDASLLEEIRCRIALGEFEAAEANVRSLFITGDDPDLLREARYLGSQIAALKTGDVTLLSDAAADNADWKPALLYTQWKLSGAEVYQAQLRSEYPASPEARILAGTDAPNPVSGAPTAMWLLLSGREGLILGEPVAALASAGPASVTASAPVTSPASTAAAPPAADPVSASTAVTPGEVLQTGLFSREANAQAMAERLRNAGFTASITIRQVNGASYWAVSVPPGGNVNATILRLKVAGFESFPIQY